MSLKLWSQRQITAQTNNTHSERTGAAQTGVHDWHQVTGKVINGVQL